MRFFFSAKPLSLPNSDFLNPGPVQAGDDFQFMQMDTDEAARNAPARKRRQGGAEEDRLPQEMPVAAGKLEEVEMEVFLVYKPEKGQPMRARDGQRVHRGGAAQNRCRPREFRNLQWLHRLRREITGIEGRLGDHGAVRHGNIERRLAGW